jgi:hypothetical protein
MVGTSAIVAFLARKASTARRKTGTVRAIMGLRDIWTQSFGRARRGDPPWRVAVDLTKRVAQAPSDTWVEKLSTLSAAICAFDHKTAQCAKHGFTTMGNLKIGARISLDRGCA